MPEQLKPCPACGSRDCASVVCTISRDEHQSLHYYVGCDSCCASGPALDIEADAIAAWNSMPRALTWTTEPPKVAGWYFSREKWASGKWRNYGPMKVYADNETGVLQVKGWGKTLGGVAKYGDSGDSVEWAGPIPTPLEPEVA